MIAAKSGFEDAVDTEEPLVARDLFESDFATSAGMIIAAAGGDLCSFRSLLKGDEEEEEEEFEEE